MSLPLLTFVQNVDLTWTVSWAAVPGALFFRIVLWGTQIDTTALLSYTYSGQAYTTYPPPLEVVPNGLKTLSELYSPLMLLQWYGQGSTISYYDLEQLAPTVQALQQQVENGQWVYSYQTPVLLDETTYSYSVASVDVLGNESSAEVYTNLIVCPPLPPDAQIVLSYVHSGHSIQVAAVP
jgi:hypothetical protein